MARTRLSPSRRSDLGPNTAALRTDRSPRPSGRGGARRRLPLPLPARRDTPLRFSPLPWGHLAGFLEEKSRTGGTSLFLQLQGATCLTRPRPLTIRSGISSFTILLSNAGVLQVTVCLRIAA